MRALLIAFLALTCWSAAPPPAAAGSYQADGSYTGSPSARVAALFNAYPNGGDGLINAVRELLMANPGLADDVAYLATRAAPGPRADAAAGMAQAFLALTHRGDTNGAAQIVSAAQLSGNPVIQTTVATVVGNVSVYGGQTSNPLTGQSNCRAPVSPAGPVTCQ